MARLIIVSNRLPVRIQESEEGMEVFPSEGGLATGLKSYHKSNNSVWIGWPGISANSKKQEGDITSLLSKEHCLPVFLNKEDVDLFYLGFSNVTIWPLFHYFTEYTEFKSTFWEAYKKVNQKFAETIIKTAKPNDSVWVHDYQLLLLPAILRKERPDLRIGFFLHIPFPSYEVFRILPYRKELLAGMLGADLLGFHTYDYARHFLSATKRLLGHEVNFSTISMNNRKVFVDVFPMGIDYEKFKNHAYKVQSKPIQERSKEHQDIDRFLLGAPNRKMILSIDRLDYTKGLPSRLKAFRLFLRKYPEYKEHVSLMLLTVSSRVDVEQYQTLKSEVEELVGGINGEFATINWSPVIYFYRSLPFENLIELYSSTDIALLTPLRDGMNLVAKEFIATKINHKGVLILSEMAGATKELGEAISVNPSDVGQVADAIYQALTMSDEEQLNSIIAMQDRIKRYDVYKWASDFVKTLAKTEERIAETQSRKVSGNVVKKLKAEFSKKTGKVLFLDYDGTLKGFYGDPKAAVPDRELYDILNDIVALPDTELVLISGRDKATFDAWFGKCDYTLIAEHGVWLKEKGQDWKERKPYHNEWKDNVRPLLESYVDRTPGSLIEEKTHSLVWHYRKADIELSDLRALELRLDASNIIQNQDLEILEGNKVVEIKVAGVNKGSAALDYLHDKKIDFLMAVGDDWTDEFLFKELPEDAITIKVGTDKSVAKYFIDDYTEVRKLLKTLTEKNKK